MHDLVIKVVHWKLCGRLELDRAGQWYEHIPETVVEDETVKFLWDMTLRCDQVIEAGRPDLVVVDRKEQSYFIIQVAIPGDSQIFEREIRK